MAREAERRDAMVTCGYQVLVGERQLAQAVKAHFSGWLCHPGIPLSPRYPITMRWRLWCGRRVDGCRPNSNGNIPREAGRVMSPSLGG